MSFSWMDNLPGTIHEALDEELNFTVFLIDFPILDLWFSLALSFSFSNLLNSEQLRCLSRKMVSSLAGFSSLFRSFSLSFPRWSPRVPGFKFLFNLEEEEEEVVAFVVAVAAVAVVVVDEGQRPLINPESSWLRWCFLVLWRFGERDWFGDGIPASKEVVEVVLFEVGDRNLELTSRDFGLLGLRDWSETTTWSFSFFMFNFCEKWEILFFEVNVRPRKHRDRERERVSYEV